MNDNSPNSRLPRPIHSQTRNFSPQPINSDLYDPMQQMHIPINHHHQSIPHDIRSYPHNSYQNSFNNERSPPSFENKYNFQTTYNQFHEYQQTPNLNAPASSSFYCPHCPHCKSKADGNLTPNLPNVSKLYDPMRKPEYRGNFQPPQSSFPLNCEEALFKPLFEHPSPSSRPNQHNTFTPTFVPPSENKTFVYSSHMSVSSSVRQETPNVYIPPPTLPTNIPRNAGRNFQYSSYSGPGPNNDRDHDHGYKRAIRPTSSKYNNHQSYAEDQFRVHNSKAFHNGNGKNFIKSPNSARHQRNYSEENNRETRPPKSIKQKEVFNSMLCELQKPESDTVDIVEEFSFKKKKKKLKYDDEVIDIISSDSPEEGPPQQISLQQLLNKEKGNYQSEETEQRKDDDSGNPTVIQNFMNSKIDFRKQQEEQKRQEEEAETANKDERTRELAEIISRKEEKIFKDKKAPQQTIKFQKDIMKLITKEDQKDKVKKAHKKKKKIKKDTDPLEKIFDQIRAKNKNVLRKPSSSKEKPLKSTNFLDDLANFDLFDPSSDLPSDPKFTQLRSRDRPRRPINSKRNFTELDDHEKEQKHLDYLQKHFKSEDGIGLDAPKTRKNDEEVSSAGPLQSEFYDSPCDEPQYFAIDDPEYGIILECYSSESDFVDIHEVKRKIQDFETIGRNKENIKEIGDVVYPKKAVIHIGEAYQAHIPAHIQSSSPVELRNICILWDPDKLDQESFNVFMWKLSCLFGTSKSRINEQKAIEILVHQNYNVEQALEFCSANLDRVKRKILCK